MSATQPPQGSADAVAAAGSVNDDELTLQIAIGSDISPDDLRTVRASKAALGLLSSVLKVALATEPSCTTLKVDGSLDAWRFVASYLSSTTFTRLAAFPHTDHGAQLLAEVFAVADQYDMPLLVEEIVAAARRWPPCASYLRGLDPGLKPNQPSCPAWWIDLADKYGRVELAAPAVKALMTDAAAGYGSSWSRSVFSFGRESKGTLWKTLTAMLEALKS